MINETVIAVEDCNNFISCTLALIALGGIIAFLGALILVVAVAKAVVDE